MILRLATVFLLILTPIAWFTPLMRAGLLPLFGLAEVSVISGISSLLDEDILLAVLVVLLALVAPIAKLIGLLLIQLNRAPRRWLPTLNVLGKLAMADVFLIAIYIVVVKGVGIARVETAWGLYFFTFCILATFTVGHLIERREKAD